MARFSWSTSSISIAVALAGSVLVATVLHGQISEADKKKRDAFLKAREEMRTIAPTTPSDSPTPSGKPKASKKKGKGKGKKSSPTPEPTKSGSPKKRTAAEPDETPSPSKKVAPEEDATTPVPTATPVERSPAIPRAVPPAVTTPMPDISVPPADITIQKSGLEGEQGFEPPPPPPPQRGFWGRMFGGRSTPYRYLNRRVLEAIRRAPVQRSRWKFIIVHNSGTRQGNARAFDYYHRRVRKMKNGMAYHFVVGNGSSSGNGEIEIGDRWRRQINGGHVHSDYLNNISLGVCLVGDFNRERPTRVQMEATEELIRYLRERCGRAEGRVIPVRPHREMNPPRWGTDCPGDAFPYGWFRKF